MVLKSPVYGYVLFKTIFYRTRNFTWTDVYTPDYNFKINSGIYEFTIVSDLAKCVSLNSGKVEVFSYSDFYGPLKDYWVKFKPSEITLLEILGVL